MNKRSKYVTKAIKEKNASDVNDAIIKLNAIFKQGRQILQSRSLPNHNAFTISEVLGACLGLPKEHVIEQLLKQ